MKKLILAVLLALCLAVPCRASDITIQRVTVMDGSTAVAAGDDYSGTTTTYTVGNREGFFSIQASATGSGAAKIEYYVSMDGTNFAEPSGASDIITGLTSSSGTVTAAFDPPLCESLRIVVTETGGASSITPTIYLMYR